MPVVLKIVMISHGCMPLQWLWYYEPSFIVNASFVFIELKFQSFIQDSIAFKEVFECNVSFWASTISFTVKGYISSSSLWFANT
jgi:hypothetical protein